MIKISKIFENEVEAKQYSKEKNIPMKLETNLEEIPHSEIRDSEITELEEKRPIKDRIREIFVDWRVGRLIMFFLITASVTLGLQGTWQEILYAGAIGVTLSFSGFFLDYILDFAKDRESGKLSNPIARGTLHPILASFLVILTFSASLVFAVFTNVYALIPIGALILVILGLGLGILDTPILRAISLGILQGLYVLIGALVANKLVLGAGLLALFLFFLRFGFYQQKVNF